MKGKQIRTNSGLEGLKLAKLIELTGKAISGEWGDDDDTGNGIPVLRTTNFTNDGIINYDNVVTRTIGKSNIEEKYLRKGDIIIEKSGGSDKQPVGRVVYFDAEENKYLFNNFTGLLRIKDHSICYPRFLFYVLYFNYKIGGTIPFQNKTTGLHNLKTDDYVKKAEITLLPITEQMQIVSTLDKLQSIITHRKQQLEKLDEL
ncbi:MAG: restriction endonuclease subunit S, partial [Ruminococcus sp.]|nr:restriction endonuclease subunit S [Ruminococcus sp.]